MTGPAAKTIGGKTAAIFAALERAAAADKEAPAEFRLALAAEELDTAEGVGVFPPPAEDAPPEPPEPPLEPPPELPAVAVFDVLGAGMVTELAAGQLLSDDDACCAEGNTLETFVANDVPTPVETQLLAVETAADGFIVCEVGPTLIC